MGRQRRRGSGVKWLNHYSSAQSILVVGDGDMSFSLALAAAFGSGENLVATSLDSYGSIYLFIFLLSTYLSSRWQYIVLESLSDPIDCHGAGVGYSTYMILGEFLVFSAG